MARFGPVDYGMNRIALKGNALVSQFMIETTNQTKMRSALFVLLGPARQRAGR
jgi:hypothetical protein